MKSTIVFSAGLSCLILMCAAGAAGAPIGNSNQGRDYLVSTAMLSPWSFGIFGEGGTREVEWKDSGFPLELESRKLMVFLGYDVIRWITPFVAFGVSDMEFGGSQGGDTELELGAGLHLNLIDQEIMDPTLYEDKLRLTANLYYSQSETTWLSNTAKVNEFSANLLLSLVNDIEGHKEYLPYSLALFAGPSFSAISGDVRETQEVGFIIGLDVFYTKRVSFNFAFEKYEQETITSGINVRF
jgi:hypothetical protein